MGATRTIANTLELLGNQPSGAKRQDRRDRKCSMAEDKGVELTIGGGGVDMKVNPVRRFR